MIFFTSKLVNNDMLNFSLVILHQFLLTDAKQAYLLDV